eukprot:g10724.t1
MDHITNLDEELKLIRDYNSPDSVQIVRAWLRQKSKGLLPQSSVGWFRCGVGFYNKKLYYGPAIICLRIALELDPNNFNAQQVLGRAYLRVNKRNEALESLKRSVELHSSSDWQLLVEEMDREDRENNM